MKRQVSVIILFFLIVTPVSAASNDQFIDVYLKNSKTGEYISEIFIEQSFGRVDVQAVITNTGTEIVQIVVYASMPNCLSVVSGSTVVKNIRNVDGKNASTDNLFSPQGLNIGSYAPGEKSIITFSVIIDDTMLTTGRNSIPISVSARMASSNEGGTLEWRSDFLTNNATLNVQKAGSIPTFQENPYPYISLVFTVIGAPFFVALFNGLIHERLKLRAIRRDAKKNG